ncbi:MAG: hypothetical protein ACRDRW_16445, partial [Pseudonocardiaceae bacterium]
GDGQSPLGETTRRCADTGSRRATRHHRAMTTATVAGIDRTGPAVREVLARFDSHACTRFEAEFHTAIIETQWMFSHHRPAVEV